VADIFISYTKIDRAWEFWIAMELEALGPKSMIWHRPMAGSANRRRTRPAYAGHNHRMGWIPPLARPMAGSGRRPRAENPPGSADMSNMG
jgi:hypothetical protein